MNRVSPHLSIVVQAAACERPVEEALSQWRAREEFEEEAAQHHREAQHHRQRMGPFQRRGERDCVRHRVVTPSSADKIG